MNTEAEDVEAPQKHMAACPSAMEGLLRYSRRKARLKALAQANAASDVASLLLMVAKVIGNASRNGGANLSGLSRIARASSLYSMAS